MEKLLHQIRPKKIMVAGEIMLDVYYKGAVKRISPEAPVPVFLKQNIAYRPGGAANTAVNLVVNQMEVCILSVTGRDENSLILKKLLDQAGIQTDGLVETDRPACTKTRLIAAGSQQVLRIDEEDDSLIDEDTQERLFRIFKTKMNDTDLVILSDYMKGMLTEELVKKMISAAREADVKVLVDAKDANAEKYKGCYLIKPNRQELALLTGMQTDSMDGVRKAMKHLAEICSPEYVLTTLGPDGMMLMDKSGNWHELKAVTQEVFDVTGAGDTVIAYLGMGIASHLTVKDAVNLANAAAGIQVLKAGTSAVTLEEAGNRRDHSAKYLNRTGLEMLRTRYRDKKIVFTNGCFDILHVGHIRYLKQASLLGDILVAGVNSDKSVEKLKGAGRPVNGEHDRLEMLAAYSFVDYVVLFGEDTPYEVIQALKPDVLVKGGDYKLDDVIGKDIVEANNGKVVITALTEGKSTSSIIDKIGQKGSREKDE